MGRSRFDHLAVEVSVAVAVALALVMLVVLGLALWRASPVQGAVFGSAALFAATTSGGYEPPRGPNDPMAVLMMCSPVPAPKGDETGRDMLRIGRHKVYATSFETYEQQIRDQLQGMLGKHGFSQIHCFPLNIF